MATTATESLTSRQQEVLDLITEGKEPTEVAKQLKVTPQQIYSTRRKLIQDGYLTPTGRVRRTKNGPTPQPVEEAPEVIPADFDGVDPVAVLRDRKDKLGAEIHRLTDLISQAQTRLEEMSAEETRVVGALEVLVPSNGR
jgi:transposase-like protein